MSFIYLASPYSSPEIPNMDIREVMFLRYRAACHATVWMLKRKHWVYSPIVHCHEIANEYDLPKEAQFWKQYNEAMLKRSEILCILCLPGWRDSKGVTHERQFAFDHDITTWFIQAFGEDQYTVFMTEPKDA